MQQQARHLVGRHAGDNDDAAQLDNSSSDDGDLMQPRQTAKKSRKSQRLRRAFTTMPASSLLDSCQSAAAAETAAAETLAAGGTAAAGQQQRYMSARLWPRSERPWSEYQQAQLCCWTQQNKQQLHQQQALRLHNATRRRKESGCLSIAQPLT